MAKKRAIAGPAHKITPADFRKALAADQKALVVWSEVTPLAKSEWICWVISGKKAETRDIRIRKAVSKLRSGMHRPCCWAGCPHRADKPLSPSQEFVYGR